MLEVCVCMFFNPRSRHGLLIAFGSDGSFIFCYTGIFEESRPHSNLSDCFPKIRFRVNIFVKNAINVTLCTSICFTSVDIKCQFVLLSVMLKFNKFS